MRLTGCFVCVCEAWEMTPLMFEMLHQTVVSLYPCVCVDCLNNGFCLNNGVFYSWNISNYSWSLHLTSNKGYKQINELT